MNVIESCLGQISETFSVDLADCSLIEISVERAEIYSSFKSDPANELKALVGSDGEGIKEYIVEISADSKARVISVSCQITFEDLSLSKCPEYCFDDEPVWRVAQLSLYALEDFKQKKFRLWEHQLQEPECEAAFRRLLQQGPIRNVFDKFIFPSSDETALKYKVVDEHSGKSVDVPHQVSRMRFWDAARREYTEFDCSLAGAPKTKEEAEIYWNKIVEEMKQLRGAEYITSLLGQK
jgi:hypothetical protein